MKLTKPIAFLDIESGCPGPTPDPARDKIVTLAVQIIQVDLTAQSHVWLFNPGFKMSAENIECHGITNEAAATYPVLTTARAQVIVETLRGCDLGGFNLIRYDVPLLWEELFRVGVELDLEGVNIVDAGNLFKKKEERSLSAAVKFYCDREHIGAHDAMNDVTETIAVFGSQLERYPDIRAMSIEEIAKFTKMDDNIDLAGKIVRGPDGEPVYNFGKVKGVKVVNDTGFARWMLDRDFSQNTKRVLRKVLGWEEPEKQNDLW